jgi:5-methyltetrahydropteroyltriglutamate--homocysteine methyltransferase
MTTPFGNTTVLGYPRIGCELKHTLEGYSARQLDADSLQATAAALRANTWRPARRRANVPGIGSPVFTS